MNKDAKALYAIIAVLLFSLSYVIGVMWFANNFI